MRIQNCCFAISLTLILLLARGYSADRLEFPQDPSLWMNSAPVTSKLLEGKAAFLWYFEEGCPHCREKWPGLLQTAKKFEGKPILFIAINSGTLPNELAAYVRESKVTWPVLCDVTRQFEKQSDVGVISLKNIHQAKIINGFGKSQRVNWDDISSAVEKALEGATWNVDPSAIPPSMKSLWSMIEFGNYPAAAALMKKAAASSKPEIKAGAQKLNEYLQSEIDQAVVSAESVGDDPWESYKAYHQVMERFAGFKLPSSVAEKLKQLDQDGVVKNEKARWKQFEAMKKTLNVSSPTAKNTSIAKLKKFAADALDTDAAEHATAMMEAIASNGP